VSPSTVHGPHVHHVGVRGGGGPAHAAVVTELHAGRAREGEARDVEAPAAVGAVHVLRPEHPGGLQRLVRIPGEQRAPVGAVPRGHRPVVARAALQPRERVDPAREPASGVARQAGRAAGHALPGALLGGHHEAVAEGLKDGHPGGVGRVPPHQGREGVVIELVRVAKQDQLADGVRVLDGPDRGAEVQRVARESRGRGGGAVEHLAHPTVHPRGPRVDEGVDVGPLPAQPLRALPPPEGNAHDPHEPVLLHAVTPEHLREGALRGASHELHLQEPVGGLEVPRREEHIRVAAAVDVRHPEAVAEHLDVGRRPREGRRAARRGRTAPRQHREPRRGDPRVDGRARVLQSRPIARPRVGGRRIGRSAGRRATSDRDEEQPEARSNAHGAIVTPCPRAQHRRTMTARRAAVTAPSGAWRRRDDRVATPGFHF
jgi:hypothetical protein